MSDGEKINELRRRYFAAMHAVQSGIAMKMNYDTSDTSDTTLRVGVNSAMVDHGALARLLIGKGLITELEYMEALATQAEKEKAMYERELFERFGRKVTLGCEHAEAFAAKNGLPKPEAACSRLVDDTGRCDDDDCPVHGEPGAAAGSSGNA